VRGTKSNKEPGRYGGIKQWSDALGFLNGAGLPIRLKLFLLLALLVVSILFSVLVILSVTGTFTSGLRETEKDLTQELDRLAGDITGQFGRISAHTVEFSEVLSKDIEKELESRNISVTELQSHPEILESLVQREYDKSLLAMQKANSSGVFFILDATVNPSLENSSESKTGLYIKNMEPNILNASSEFTLILRGFSSVGRQNGVTLHPQWRMEFDVSDSPYYKRPMDAAREKVLPLSRLFYWSDSLTLPGTTEQVMLCTAPLIDSRGNPFGVCGFEVSAMLFKLSHMPGNNISERAIGMLAPGSDHELMVSRALVTGGYAMRSFKEQNQILGVRRDEPFNSYRQYDGTLFSGLHKPVSLYPEDSAFNSTEWTVALIVPDEDISASVILMNLKLLSLFFGLLVIGVAISYFLSRKFLLPFFKGVEIIKSNDYMSRTNVAEIDDLIEFLSASKTNRKTGGKSKDPEKLPDSLFDEFVKNTKSLSPAERSVFNLYVEGYTAKEITNILCLSINTIKTHNKRIYMKLNVASREELLVYVNMLKEAGKESELF